MKIFSIILTFLLIISNLFAHELSVSDQAEFTDGSFLDFIYLGAKHMVTGYDHILFLVGIIFFLSKLSDIIKFVTAFTLGHSITLVFATFYTITANYYLIDALIAFSVIYKGFENLDGFKKVFSRNAPNLILMIFLFGLIHGFGLSTRLQQLPLNGDNLLLSILSFNFGVELGQITALLIAYPIILILRGDSFKKISTMVNWGLVVCGIALFIYQLNGYLTDTHQEEDHGTQVEVHEDNTQIHSHEDGEPHSHEASTPQQKDVEQSQESTQHSHDDGNEHQH